MDLTTSRHRFVPERENKFAGGHRSRLEEKVEVNVLGGCVNLASLHVIHDLWLVKRDSFDQSRGAVLEILDSDIHHVIKVCAAGYRHFEGAHVTQQKLSF